MKTLLLFASFSGSPAPAFTLPASTTEIIVVSTITLAVIGFALLYVKRRKSSRQITESQ